MATFSLKRYKEAIVYIKHIEEALKIVNLAIKGLSYYKIFSPVQVILITLSEEKLMLELHLKEYKKIRDKKGQV